MIEKLSIISVSEESVVKAILAVLGLIFVFLLLFRFFANIRDFKMQLRYLNEEISRTDGQEREHYKRMKKRLWLSLIPFF